MKKLLFLISFFCTLPSIAADHNDHKNDHKKYTLSIKEMGGIMAAGITVAFLVEWPLDCIIRQKKAFSSIFSNENYDLSIILSYNPTTLKTCVTHGVFYSIFGVVIAQYFKN